MLAGRKTDGEIVNGASGVKREQEKKFRLRQYYPPLLSLTLALSHGSASIWVIVQRACAGTHRQTGPRGGREQHAQHANELRNKAAPHEERVM